MLDWRMAWEGDSYVAKGLYSAIDIAKSLKSDLIFITDGHELPPLPFSGLPPFEGKPGDVGGLIVGVGSHTPDAAAQVRRRGPRGRHLRRAGRAAGEPLRPAAARCRVAPRLPSQVGAVRQRRRQQQRAHGGRARAVPAGSSPAITGLAYAYFGDRAGSHAGAHRCRASAPAQGRHRHPRLPRRAWRSRCSLSSYGLAALALARRRAAGLASPQLEMKEHIYACCSYALRFVGLMLGAMALTASRARPDAAEGRGEDRDRRAAGQGLGDRQGFRRTSATGTRRLARAKARAATATGAERAPSRSSRAAS